jgi:metal-dependent amidase/aminoacylase/carboxypeptidase family protein
MEVKDAARKALQEQQERLISLSRRIHATPELAFEEEKASWLSFEASEFAGFIDRATETYWEQSLRGKVPELRMELRPVNPPQDSSGAAGH